jgi:hypothetical protein
MDAETKEKAWRAEEAIEPPTVYPPEMKPEEVKKREDEKVKILEHEIFETQNVARRKTYRMWIHGKNFIKTESLKVKFTFNGGIAMKEVEGVFKNS